MGVVSNNDEARSTIGQMMAGKRLEGAATEG
jgi:hypothetical protein